MYVDYKYWMFTFNTFRLKHPYAVAIFSQRHFSSKEMAQYQQTGTDLMTRFKEHIRDERMSGTKSKHTQCILHCNHEHSPNENTAVIRASQKGKNLDILDRFHIYKVAIKKL